MLEVSKLEVAHGASMAVAGRVRTDAVLMRTSRVGLVLFDDADVFAVGICGGEVELAIPVEIGRDQSL